MRSRVCGDVYRVQTPNYAKIGLRFDLQIGNILQRIFAFDEGAPKRAEHPLKKAVEEGQFRSETMPTPNRGNLRTICLAFAILRVMLFFDVLHFFIFFETYFPPGGLFFRIREMCLFDGPGPVARVHLAMLPRNTSIWLFCEVHCDVCFAKLAHAAAPKPLSGFIWSTNKSIWVPPVVALSCVGSASHRYKSPARCSSFCVPAIHYFCVFWNYKLKFK